MSNSILEMIMGQLGGDKMSKVGEQAGTSEEQARQGLSAAVPLLLGAMERNASSTDGAESLNGALKRDHDGSILDNIQGFLSNPAQANGAGILKHVLGDKREKVQNQVAASAGVDSSAMSKLLEMAAPLVMGAIGRQLGQQGIGASQLSGFLGGHREQSEAGAGMLGLVSNLLDADKDGDVTDDLLSMGKKLFGGK